MSVILITHHDESIYGIVDQTPAGSQLSKKALGYRSKFRDRIKDYKPCKKKHATMGVPEECPPNPKEYLRKHTGKLVQAKCELLLENKLEKVMLEKKERLIPTREEIKLYDENKAKRPTENFIRKNIKDAVNMKSKEPVQKVVIEKCGTTKRLIDGLEPIYIKSNVFGKTPKYLQKFIEINERIYQMNKDKSGTEKPKCKYITRDERDQLLHGLKTNWEELQREYQGLPILTDTIPKKMRKTKLETQLKQLEKDIVLIERHPYIYVYDE